MFYDILTSILKQNRPRNFSPSLAKLYPILVCSQWACDQPKPKLVLSSIPQKVINIYCYSHSYYQRVVNKPWTCSQSDEWTNHLCQLPYCRDLAAHMHTQLAVCIISSICCLRLCIRYILCTNIMCVCIYIMTCIVYVGLRCYSPGWRVS